MNWNELLVGLGMLMFAVIRRSREVVDVSYCTKERNNENAVLVLFVSAEFQNLRRMTNRRSIVRIGEEREKSFYFM
jgi:hypothetical protein